MRKRRIKLITLFQLITIAAVVALTTIILSLHLFSQAKKFNQQTESMRSDHVKQQKELIKREVERVVAVINERRSRSEQETRSRVKQRVYEACAVADNIYQQNKATRSKNEIEKMIQEVLRALRFEQGVGYYFIARLDGTEILFSDRAELEGENLLNMQDTNGKFVVKDMIAIARQSGEGFYEYHWTKPAVTGNDHKKISYIKQFEPFDWFIGTGLYVEDVEAQIKANLLLTISNIRFGQDGYIFVNSWNGDALVANGSLISAPRKLWEVFAKDPDKTRSLFAQEYDAALKPDGDYIDYSMSKLTDPGKEFPKSSFIYGIPDLQWLVGAGVYLDDVEFNIAALQAELELQQRSQILSSLWVAGAIIIFILIAFYLVSSRLKKDLASFVNFIALAAYEDKEIDSDQIYFDDLSLLAESANTMLHDKKTALEKLRLSEEKYRNFFDSAMVGFFRSRLSDGLLLDVNGKVAEVLGCEIDEIVGKLTAQDLFSDISQRQKLLEKLEKEGKVTDFEEELLLPDGRKFFCSISVIAYPDKDYMEGIAIDISERKHAEEEILQLRKLESVGVLAGGIAHDFNNLLAGLFGNIELAKRLIPDAHKSYKYLESAGLSMERATGLTQQLLTFAKGGDPIKETLSLEGMIAETATFSLRGSNVKLQFDIDPNLWLVAADKGQLSQVISNLVINAKQSMPDGGIITISAENIEGAEGKKVRISVKDQGIGIATQYLSKVFDPYFSTKQQGSGLGLASCYSIITKHNGSIAVESELNHGTTFTITLPAVESQEEQLAAVVEEEASPDNVIASARILVLDDEELVQRMSGAMLEEMGHQVDYALHGEEAVRKYRLAHEEGQGYGLVICDLTIPGGMGGQEAAQEILKVNPQANIIVSSGYASDPVMADYMDYGFKGRVAKPYRFVDLQNEVRQTLEG